MIGTSLSLKARDVLLQDAIHRDLTTSRRAALLDLLWQERFLTREQLKKRVEMKLGKDCFGKAAWEDNIYRDIRIVKHAFAAIGFRLVFSRSSKRSGYFLSDQAPISPELKKLISGASAEVDLRQMDIYSRLLPADRFRQGCVISDTARNVVAYRIRQENPEISLAEANRLALQRAYFQ